MFPDDTVHAVHCYISLCVLCIIASENDGPLHEKERVAKTVAVQKTKSELWAKASGGDAEQYACCLCNYSHSKRREKEVPHR